MDLRRLYDDVMDFVCFFGACGLLLIMAGVAKVRNLFFPGAALLAVLLVGCTFKPVRIDGIPEECNLCYSAMRLYYKSEDKSGATKYIDACARVLRQERCRKAIFGDKVIYSDREKYRDYSECLKEL